MPAVLFTDHALLQCRERGATEDEVMAAVASGIRESAKQGRVICKRNFDFRSFWQGRWYSVKQVCPVIAEEPGQTVVVTVYVYYF